MEIILILLTSTVLGAFFVGFFFLGFKLGKEYQNRNDGRVEIDETNVKTISEITNWLNYKG